LRKPFETAGMPAPRQMKPLTPDLAVDIPDASAGFRAAARLTGLRLGKGFA
jgi:hypothetical protein